MNNLDKLLNEPESLKQTEALSPKPITRPTAAANKANCLADQDNAIAAASVGSHIYRSAATLLAANQEARGFMR